MVLKKFHVINEIQQSCWKKKLSVKFIFQTQWYGKSVIYLLVNVIICTFNTYFLHDGYRIIITGWIHRRSGGGDGTYYHSITKR